MMNFVFKNEEFVSKMMNFADPDVEHFPSSGSDYKLLVTKPASAKWDWLPAWGEDEGALTTCATSKITETQNKTAQMVHWEIGVPKNTPGTPTSSEARRRLEVGLSRPAIPTIAYLPRMWLRDCLWL